MTELYQFLAFTIVDIATIVVFFRLVKAGNIKALNHVYKIVSEIVADKVNDAIQPFAIELQTQKDLLNAIMNSVQVGGQIDAERLLILEKKSTI